MLEDEDGLMALEWCGMAALEQWMLEDEGGMATLERWRLEDAGGSYSHYSNGVVEVENQSSGS